MTTSMQGKTCLITGATAGIGEITALELVRLGATVVIVGRNEQKCRAVVERIQRETGNAQVAYLVADLSAQAEVRRCATTFKQRYDRLDVLVNNAGAIFSTHQLSADGIEMTWALNHLGYFLLTNLLLDVLQASAPARIVNVASAAHERGRLRFDDLQRERGYSGWGAYSQSKLANVMFTYELARRLKGTNVTANALHPGVVATAFATNNGIWGTIQRHLMNLISISPQHGAQTSIYLAAAPDVEGISGAYFDNQHPLRSSKRSYNQADQRRLWEISARQTGLEG